MFEKNLCSPPPAPLLLALLVGLSAPAFADKELSRGDRRWLEEEVAALITPQEVSVFMDIDSDDRGLFKELFWARRDTNLTTEDSEFEELFKDRREIADRQYREGRTKGSLTDRGKIFLLLGEPNATSQGGTGETIWTYDADARLGIPDGLTITFRDQKMVTSEELEQALTRIKTRLITNPTVVFTTNAEGRLLEPARRPDPNSPANQILLALRESQTPSPDIPFDTTIGFFRAGEGSIYIPILFDIDPATLNWGAEGAKVTVFGVVETADGHPIYQFEQPASLTRAPDGSAAYELPIQLQPGRYKLYLGVQDVATTTAGTQIHPLEVPDFSTGKLVLSSVIVYDQARQVPDTAGTPGHAFQFGPIKFYPTREFETTDSIGLMFFIYGFGVDSASGRPNITGQYTFFQEGTRRGQTAEEPIQADPALGQGLGNAEIPLSSFQPGDCTVEIKITDHVREEVLTEEIEFVVGGEKSGQ